jgi:Flp pilus assembly protein TadG
VISFTYCSGFYIASDRKLFGSTTTHPCCLHRLEMTKRSSQVLFRTMNSKSKSCRRGAATVELAIVLPVLVTLFLGMCEVGRALNATTMVVDAAAFGGRLASIGQSTNAQVKQSVLACLTVSGIPTTNAVVTVNDLTQPGTDVGQATSLDKLQVVVTVPFKDVRWGVSGFIVQNTNLVTGRATFYSAKVNPYPTNISVPAGF